MAIPEAHEIAYELTNTIVSLQQTIRNVKQKISKDQQDFVFDSSQPVRSMSTYNA
jgi:hypothetical protein